MFCCKRQILKEILIMGNSIRTTCGICQIGCGVLATLTDGKVTKVAGDPDHPLNKGLLCPKGLASLEYLYHPTG